MEWLTVKNWSEFQHYKDRNPPWIKLHRALLDDYEFSALPDAAKGQLILIWLFASQNEGKIPHDAKFLEKKLGLTDACELLAMVEMGFLIPEQVASKPLAKRKQVASNVLDLTRSREEKSFRKATEAETDARFTDFYEAYPRKVSKADAIKAWQKLNPDAALILVMMAALNRQKKSLSWTKDNGDFVPHPSTWLNKRRWEDGTPVSANGTAVPSYMLDNVDYMELAKHRDFGAPQ